MAFQNIFKEGASADAPVFLFCFVHLFILFGFLVTLISQQSSQTTTSLMRNN